MRRQLIVSMLSAVLGAAVLVGCPPRVKSQADLDPTSREKVEEAKRQAEAGQTEEARKLIAEIPDQENLAVGEVLFSIAEAHFNAKAFAPARDSYRELLARFPLFDKADQAKYHLALSQLELGEARDAVQTLAPLVERLPEAERPQALAQAARAAEGARMWGEALQFHVQALSLARDEATAQAERQKAIDLLESQVNFLDIAKLADDLPKDSPLWPVVQFKYAKILAHLRDWERAKEAVEDLLARAPDSPYTADARTMLERAERRAVVRPDTIGVALPLSGKYKSFGDTAMEGIRLALEGSKLRIVTRDTAGDPTQARQAIAELAQDEQVIAIIGPVLSSESEDAAAESELQETPIVTLTRAENITDVGNFVFRNMLTNKAQADALADWAMRVRGFKSFAVLYPNIPYGNELANLFWDGIEERGGVMRGAETYDADQTTFSPVVKKLVGRYYLDEREEFGARRRAILDTVKDPYRQRKMLEDARKSLSPVVDFEALFIPDYFKTIGLVAPALAVEDVITNVCDKRDLERIAKTQGRDVKELRPVQLLGGNGWNFNELVERGGKFVQCAVFVDGFFAKSDRKETKVFVDRFRSANNREPGLLEAVGYDTGKILRTVIEQQRPSSRPALREALLKVKDFPGATGRTSFNEKREAEKPLFMLTIDGGEIREIDSDVRS